MTRMLLLLLFLLLPLQGCRAQNQEKITPEPEITEQAETPDPYSWDFGQVKEGEALRHAFTLKNESQATLNIKDINTSCGCTVSTAEKKVLLPQESTSVEVKFDTKGFSGPTEKYIYVHTDSPDNPVFRFIIKAEIIKSKIEGS